MTLRTRILLTVAPLLLLTATLGAADAVLLYQMGRNIDYILRDNLRSVDYMVDLNTALDGIDGAFRMKLLGRPGAREQYEQQWKEYKAQQDLEAHNVTILPREQELVNELDAETDAYRRAGDHFFEAPSAERYFGGGDESLAAQYRKVRHTTDEIRLLNEREMKKASDEAKSASASWGLWLAVGLAVTALFVLLLAWTTVRAVLGPLRNLAQTAVAVGAGNFDQLLPTTDDEVGQAARAFNQMTRQLRDYRQSYSARLLRAQRTGQAVLDSFPDPILVLDPEGQVEMANPAARRVLGVAGQPSWNQPTEKETPPAEIWQPPESLRHPLADALQKQQPFVTQAFDQTIGFRLDGEERAYLPQILPIRDPYGITLGAAVVLSDVTKFRLMDQIKTDLAATVSHELKTPLTGVRLVLHLLLEETVGPLTPKQTELLVDARDNAERLLSTIEHLLGLARLERGGDLIQIQREEPAVLLETAAAALRPRAAARRVELIVENAEDVPAVGVDAQRFSGALNNLLDNALKYTEEGGRITLAATPVGEDRVRFAVADTGKGIPGEYLPHVFEKFFRVPGDGSGRGTGLGLAIVREIVLAHHGEVAVESTLGKGTVFSLTIPVWKM